jgi:prepilin-type N-terminal cleavage/methylation domain-containing protein
MTSNRHQHAMTFLEIMVVIVILGVMLAVVLPNMAGPRSKAALRSSVKDIAAAGLLARQRAITQGEKTYLILYPEEKEWRIDVTPITESDTHSRRRLKRANEAQSSDEQPRKLPKVVGFTLVRIMDEIQELQEEEYRLVFYPNGSCSGLAVQLTNNREKSLTVDFEEGSGIPEIYSGEPKSFAMKLKEKGLNPADYGLEDPDSVFGKSGKAGEGFYLSAGWNEEERVNYYEDAVSRMLNKAQTKKRIEEDGIGVYYSEAGQWGN